VAEVGLNSNDSFNHDVRNGIHGFLGLKAFLFQNLQNAHQASLVPFILGLFFSSLEFLILLVDSEVSEMHEQIVQVILFRLFIGLSSKSPEAVLE